MSNSTVLPFTFAAQQMVIYVGIFLLVAGLIGSPFILLVFLSLRTFRQSSCVFYLTVMSIVNIFHLFYGLFTYIIINGFTINWLNMSLLYCKFRLFFVQLGLLTSFSCMCFATIDQFLATSSRPQWHRWCHIKVARYMLIGAVILWILHGIPFIVYHNHTLSPITGKTSCIITNVIFQKYYNVFYGPVLISTLPIIIMILFGILAYRNVQQIAYRAVPLVRRELDKQLTTIVLVQVFYDAIALIPLAIMSIFNSIYGIPSDPLLAAQLTFITALGYTIYNFRFAGSFYIYVCVSQRFRQQLLYVLFTIHFNRFRHGKVNNNQVEPET